MYIYAQIDESGLCVSVSYLAAEVEADYMLLLDTGDDVQPGDIWDGEGWTRPDPEPLPEPQPTPDQQRITQLEDQNLMLMEAIADLYEMILGA